MAARRIRLSGLPHRQRACAGRLRPYLVLVATPRALLVHRGGVVPTKGILTQWSGGNKPLIRKSESEREPWSSDGDRAAFGAVIVARRFGEGRCATIRSVNYELYMGAALAEARAAASAGEAPETRPRDTRTPTAWASSARTTRIARRLGRTDRREGAGPDSGIRGAVQGAWRLAARWSDAGTLWDVRGED